MNITSELVEDVPVPDDGFERAIAAGNRTLRRRRAVSIAGCTVLAAVMFIGVLAARNTADEHLSTAGSLPTTEALTRPDAALLTLPAAALAATPTVPAGWQTIYYGFGQMAVPADWQPLRNPTGSQRCSTVAGTVVLLGGGTFGESKVSGPPCTPLA